MILALRAVAAALPEMCIVVGLGQPLPRRRSEPAEFEARRSGRTPGQRLAETPLAPNEMPKGAVVRLFSDRHVDAVARFHALSAGE